MRDGTITSVETKKPETVKKISPSSYYYKKLFPELPTIETRAKTLASLILRGYSQQEIKRLEYFLNQRFNNQIDKDLLRMVLDRPFKSGGVGLWKQKAEKIAEYVEGVIQEEKELEALYKKLEKNPEAPLYEEVQRIHNWLLQGFTLKLTPLQTERLNEAVSERLRNIITAENFQKVLDLAKDKGGVGLRIKTSLKLTEKLETILGREQTILEGWI